MAHFNITTSVVEARRFADLAYGQGWNLALHTPVDARPAAAPSAWQDEIRAVALVVWMAQPDGYGGKPLVDDRAVARARFEDAFLLGFGDCLRALACPQCGAARVDEPGGHFCSNECRQAWRERERVNGPAAGGVCRNCDGLMPGLAHEFCGVLCEAEWTAARAAS